MKLLLPPQSALTQNNEHDPLPFYYRPVLGWLYRKRLAMGLSLIPDGGSRILEVGVGSGILIPTLSAAFQHYTGIDLVLTQTLSQHVHPKCNAEFRVADLLDTQSLPATHFDIVVCLSVLEHIADSDRAAHALARTLVEGGTLIVGYPMVNPFMSRAFNAIGFNAIDDHHITTPIQIERSLSRVLRLDRRTTFPPFCPPSLALYQCTSWRKP
jgi:2-polyprenyl-3-methyl-5-hydroxy-6-metoxy-1,4-benzoquinol methylase